MDLIDIIVLDIPNQLSELTDEEIEEIIDEIINE